MLSQNYPQSYSAIGSLIRESWSHLRDELMHRASTKSKTVLQEFQDDIDSRSDTELGKSSEVYLLKLKTFQSGRRFSGWASSVLLAACLLSGISFAMAKKLSAPNWRVEYFANPDLRGAPEIVDQDRGPKHRWMINSPHPKLPPDEFSARWSSVIETIRPTGVIITATSDDGLRIFLDNKIVIDAWKLQSSAKHTYQGILPEGETPIIVEFFEKGGDAIIEVDIVSQPKGAIEFKIPE